jgi:hypothetical protein
MVDNPVAKDPIIAFARASSTDRMPTLLGLKNFFMETFADEMGDPQNAEFRHSFDMLMDGHLLHPQKAGQPEIRRLQTTLLLISIICFKGVRTRYCPLTELDRNSVGHDLCDQVTIETWEPIAFRMLEQLLAYSSVDNLATTLQSMPGIAGIGAEMFSLYVLLHRTPAAFNQLLLPFEE